MALKKRSLSIAGHATSITLEDEFWQELQRAADAKKQTVPQLVKQIDSARDAATTNLSSAIRLYVLQRLKDKT